MTTEVTVTGSKQKIILQKRGLNASEKSHLIECLMPDIANGNTRSHLSDNLQKISDAASIGPDTVTQIQIRGTVYSNEKVGHTATSKHPYRLIEVGQEVKLCPNGIKKEFKSWDKAPITVRKTN